jgi:CRISPR system Cascade subunit CasB
MNQEQRSSESIYGVLKDDVSSRVMALQRGVLNRERGQSHSLATAQLAILRRCDPADPAGRPESWPIVQADTPPLMTWGPGSGDEPTDAERARYCALVLYAIHQQGVELPMHVPGVPFVRAVRRASQKRGNANELDSGLRARLDKAVLAPSWLGRATHLSALVRILRTETVGFDYAELACDLMALAGPATSKGVRMRWGRGLYVRIDELNPKSPDSEQTTNANPNEGVSK